MTKYQKYRTLMAEAEHPETDEHDADCALDEAVTLASNAFKDSTIPVGERLQIADIYLKHVDIDEARRVVKEIAATA